MFGLRQLKTPADLAKICTQALSSIEVLKQRLSATGPSLSTLYLIDEISDITTTAADVSQACLILHPKSEFRQAAAEAQNKLSQAFLDLNSEPMFYQKLIDLKLSRTFAVLSPGQKIYTDRLIADFEKEGLHLDQSFQASKSSIRASADEAASGFMANISRSRTRFFFKYDEIEEVPIGLRPEKKGEMYELKPQRVYGLNELKELMSSCKNSSVRKRAYEALMSACETNEPVLQALISARQQYAQLLGFPSYADYTLKYQMFPISSENLLTLIEENYKDITKKLSSELEAILDLKARLEQEDRNNPVMLAPWDLQYYSSLILRSLKGNSVPKLSLHHSTDNYFTLKNVYSGLQILLREVFGLGSAIRLDSDSWCNDIVTMEVTRDSQVVGVLYFDMFARPHKFSTTAAKINLICARQTSMLEEIRQVPQAVLVCNLKKPPEIAKRIQLTLSDIETITVSDGQLTEIYHEFGHALHSLVSDCEFQCFSGTRVPLDLAEFPSHLFEMFLTDYDFVACWALHKTAGSPIPEPLCRTLFSVKQQQFKGLQHQLMLTLSLFDLIVHSGQPLQEANSYVKTLQTLQFGGDKWYLSLHHLAEYGSSYYAYMVGQALAEVFWTKCFENRTMNAEAGAALVKSVMSRGGNAEGKLMIAELLQRFQVTGSSDLDYSFDIDVFALIRSYYQSFGSGDELVTAEKLKKSDSFKQLI